MKTTYQQLSLPLLVNKIHIICSVIFPFLYYMLMKLTFTLTLKECQIISVT